ncbi:2'-5' RNA ligase family protein [Mesorhizobium sp. IMUNJ 23232]|uniref:2'-5' RNA ligase family protein n=1 Tax=Mesorhizobium sp. IMUNJ 23232 TaxID=3376064 RepID=UPI0037A533E2
MYQTEFEFMAGRPRPKYPERLFIGVFPGHETARAIDQFSRKFSRELGLTGSLLKVLRLHTSIAHVSDRKHLRSADAFAAELAANAVDIPPFELTFSRMGSFRGVPKRGRPLLHPLVLVADEGPVQKLYDVLGTNLRKFRFPIPEEYWPHLTLPYNEQFVPMRSIEPITLQIDEFALVHSELWLTKYNIIRRWKLH